MKKTAVIFFTLLVLGCEPSKVDYGALNSTLWMQSSAEYIASVQQAMNTAQMHLDEALRNKNWTAALEQEQRGAYQNLKPAVIFDVDETVLDNSPYEAYLINSGQTFHPETWKIWVNAARAEPIKGVKELIEEIKSQGVDVFYVTNRDVSLEEATVKNLKTAIDSDIKAEQVLCKGEIGDKSRRRAEIAKTHRIVMLFGDNYNDFKAMEGSPSPKARAADVQPYNGYWGTKWILLSNPRYGHWEQAIYNYALRLPDDEKLYAKRQHLKADSGASDSK